jgi:hypothetical protein
MSEQLNITFDEARRLAVIMRDQQAPERIEGHPGLWWIDGILTTQERGPYAIARARRHIDEKPEAEK